MVCCCLVLLRSAYVQAEAKLLVGRTCAEMEHLKDLLILRSQSLFLRIHIHQLGCEECSVGRLTS